MSARDAILNAAETLFGEVGFDGATTREITRLSGVNKALMYYYFDSKNALLDSVLNRYFDKLNEILIQAMEAEGDLRGRLKRVIDVYLDFLQHNVNFSRIVQRESVAGKHMDKIFHRLSPLFRVGMARIQEAYSGARQGEVSAEQLLISFYGMIVSYFNFGPLLGRLMNTDLFSIENVETRKKHLHWMLDVVVDELERQGQPETE